ncbi:hypothetical protein [Chryseobacterium polytrichastri]|uniref:Uncharacterized protein n=1 Tax=Chryseobacterium polytrichastri TaxID=1302687 RepID=A0A1M7LAJ8_9FLAO|nr:hypothetical protein [Chryseobacterium polytrichastri]SHM75118.1 hypothetical protein SAMN05444267_10932 [Chryseobacterium polytrichastri]
MNTNNITFSGTTASFNVNGNNNGFQRSFFKNVSTGANSRMDINVAAGAANIYLGTDTGSAIFGAGVKGYLDNRSGGRMVFASNGNEIMTIDNITGNVGIGTSTPINVLHTVATASNLSGFSYNLMDAPCR